MEAMTRRRLLCGLLVASAVLVCLAGWLVIASDRKMTRSRFEQVKKGMSPEEVIRTVGGPPDYAGSRVIPHMGFDRFGFDACWVCDEAKLIVFFDDSGTAEATAIVDVSTPPLTLTQRIRRWLGL
jgi:hypothetical protein